MSPRGELAALAAVPVGLVAARLLGLDPIAVWLSALALVLAPGWAALRLLHLDGELGSAGAAPAAAALGLAVWIPPLAAAFLLRLSLGFVVVAVLACSLAMMAFALRMPLRLEPAGLPESLVAGGAAVLFAFFSYRLSNGVVGDALFHVGRMRKLEAVSGLSLENISSFRDGAPHAGYAFPLLHAAWAGTAEAAGVDASTAFVYLQPLCALLAILGAFAVARMLTGWRTAGYLAAAVTAWDLVTLINGLVMQINQPPPFAFWVLTPAAVCLFLEAVRGLHRAAPAATAAVCVIALVHPTYAIPCLVIGAGIVAGSWRAHTSVPRSALVTLGASTLVAGAVAGWIWLVAIRGGERHTVVSHADEFVFRSGKAVLMYPWAPVFGRGYVLLGLLCLPLLARYRSLLPAMGATLALLVFLLLPGVNTVVIAAVGMGQFHRFWQVLPWPVALAAGACVLARWLRRWTIPAALLVAAATTVVRGSDQFFHTPTSILVVIAAVAAVVAAAWPPRSAALRGEAWAAALLVAGAMCGPVVYRVNFVVDQAMAGPDRPPRHEVTVEISGGVVGWFRRHDTPIPVVLGNPYRMFELVGLANVYAQALPEPRTRAEPKIHAVYRRAQYRAFFTPGESSTDRAAILARWHVDYVLLDLRDQADVASQILTDPQLTPVYRDSRFVILRVNR
ncbi:MAG: hypothetical protein ACXVYV_00010 [Gaiellales bacterium]